MFRPTMTTKITITIQVLTAEPDAQRLLTTQSKGVESRG